MSFTMKACDATAAAPVNSGAATSALVKRLSPSTERCCKHIHITSSEALQSAADAFRIKARRSSGAPRGTLPSALMADRLRNIRTPRSVAMAASPICNSLKVWLESHHRRRQCTYSPADSERHQNHARLFYQLHGLELESPLSKDALCFVLCRQRKLVVVHFGRWICRVRHDYSVRYTPVVLQAAVKNKATSPSAEGDSAHCDRKRAFSFAHVIRLSGSFEPLATDRASLATG